MSYRFYGDVEKQGKQELYFCRFCQQNFKPAEKKSLISVICCTLASFFGANFHVILFIVLITSYVLFGVI